MLYVACLLVVMRLHSAFPCVCGGVSRGGGGSISLVWNIIGQTVASTKLNISLSERCQFFRGFNLGICNVSKCLVNIL